MGSIEALGLEIAKEASVDLTRVSCRYLGLSRSMLNDKATLVLNGIRPDKLDMDELRQVDKATVVLDDVDLRGARLVGTNVEKFALSNIIWLREDARAVLYEEHEWRRHRWSGREADETELLLAGDKIVGLYRQLVLNCEARRNYELAEDFYFNEMEMLRRRKASDMGRLGRRIGNVYWWYKVLSGYGSSYARASAILGGLLLAFSAMFLVSGISASAKTVGHSVAAAAPFHYVLFPGADARWPGAAVAARDWGKALTVTLSVVTLQKDPPLSPAGPVGSVLASLLIVCVPAQAALLLFALRRRFRRGSV